jgi:hypothetical protein
MIPKGVTERFFSLFSDGKESGNLALPITIAYDLEKENKSAEICIISIAD